MLCFQSYSQHIIFTGYSLLPICKWKDNITCATFYMSAVTLSLLGFHMTGFESNARMDTISNFLLSHRSWPPVKSSINSSGIIKTRVRYIHFQDQKLFLFYLLIFSKAGDTLQFSLRITNVLEVSFKKYGFFFPVDYHIFSNTVSIFTDTPFLNLPQNSHLLPEFSCFIQEMLHAMPAMYFLCIPINFPSAFLFTSVLFKLQCGDHFSSVYFFLSSVSPFCYFKDNFPILLIIHCH